MNKSFRRICGLMIVFLITYSFSLLHAGDKLPVETGRVFIINSPVRNLDEFRLLVKQALLLKPYGKVKVNIGALTDKSFHEIPGQGSPWHEYASSNPTPFKFFPHPKLAAFIPAEFVNKNRQFLLAKANILRENGLEGAFMGYEPNFLPAAFFNAYPSMLGSRVDHPRRSTQKEFSPCVSVKETREMYAWMMAEMLKVAPEITSFSFKTNDAGAGICWAHWLYTGANGPSACKGLNMGERVRLLMNAYKAGADKAGRELSIYMDEGASNFSEEEKRDIEKYLPLNCYFKSTDNRGIQNIGGTLSSLYPVTGIINPVALFNQLQSIGDHPNKTIFIGLRAAYDRGYEPLAVSGLLFEMIVSALKESPAPKGLNATLQQVRLISDKWAGPKSSGELFNAFVALNDAMIYKAAALHRVHSLYWGVTERMINRPLVIAPQRLSKEEEAYFLTYVFNVSVEEARMDYMDIHGSRGTVTPGVVENYVQRINSAATLFEKLDDAAPMKDFFHRMALSLRIHAGIMRSCGNFAAAQVIRDRNKEVLSGPVHLPDKETSFTGHPDFIFFNNIMRDELDNTTQLIQLLEQGGIKQVILAASPVYEDRFLLGPSIIDQLKKKRKIMLDHWQDIEGYLTSPFK